MFKNTSKIDTKSHFKNPSNARIRRCPAWLLIFYPIHTNLVCYSISKAPSQPTNALNAPSIFSYNHLDHLPYFETGCQIRSVVFDKRSHFDQRTFGRGNQAINFSGAHRGGNIKKSSCRRKNAFLQ